MDQPQKAHLHKRYDHDQSEVAIYHVKYPNCIATMAADFAQHFAIVAGIPEGEDSAGRQKLRLGTPEEVAQRSCDLAAAMWAQFEARGWIMDLPDPYSDDEEETSEAG